jgi:16S rRNA pseudouridine516 synthase
MPLLRLDKIIADSGLASRREVKLLLRAGKIMVDGAAARNADVKYDSDTASIYINGEKLHYSQFRYIMMNKPQGFVCASEDRREHTVIELLDERTRRQGLFTVGRLDKDTEGLLLLTNDGEFAHRVISPKSDIVKRYFARVSGVLSKDDAARLRAGVTLADGTVCLPALLETVSAGAESECYISICEGKYHQVKRMLASLGKTVVYLKRVTIGGLELDKSLKLGEWHELDREQLMKISVNIFVNK